MKTSILIVAILALQLSACSQDNNKKVSSGQDQKNKYSKHVGGSCEGCEAIYESPVSFEKLDAVDTLPDFNQPGPKLELSGIVYQHDGKTPAKNVVIYIYHTDQSGNYTPDKNATGWAKRHGALRGWVKTDANGNYKFYTLIPAHYPGRAAPQHIHVTVKEPDKNEYWIDEYLFDNDPALPAEDRTKKQRGGNGILKLAAGSNGMMIGKRDIVLGLNVPDYPD